MSNYSPRSLAYLGDAVFELWVRQHALGKIQNAEVWHKYVTDRVNGEFQCQLLDSIEATLSEAEKDIVREGRNAPISVSRRHNQQVYRKASGFENLIGHWHLNNPERLQEVLNQLLPLLDA